ncbi:AMP-binding protein [Citricoccus nitrophenolicus]|uniref:AMP-binding protein n=1 Tax=Citricoccus nitrophenolicus TaxID=863575 RepID=UPI0031E5CAA4
MTDTTLTNPAPHRESLLTVARDPGVAGAPAIIDADGQALDFAGLRRAVAGWAALLPDVATGRRLVHLPLRRDLPGVLAYLATLEAGHVALVTSEDDRAAAIRARYRPDVLFTRDAGAPFRPAGDGSSAGPGTGGYGAPQHLLHPDLALLLSTSGSTGSPKLVRLSHHNLLSNARAIAASLRITAADRAVTSLPLHYTFGLSVLHSHLVVGGSVVLHGGSVLHEAFWEAVDGQGVTTLAVVPHMVELMESTGVLERAHPSLRLVAQAGGRMSPERILRTAALGRANGWGLAVMYGQTEATARISVLDPELAETHPDSVGRPVAGTSVDLDTTVPEAAAGTGEVVVRGPGVMMGYAEHPDDLALGPMLAELRTGDLGRIDPEGLLHLVGRRSGFVKVMGLRIDVGAVEDALEGAGYSACVGGDGSVLTVAVAPQPGRGPGEVALDARQAVARATGLGPAAVAVAVCDLPRRSNGKLDRATAADLVREAVAAASGSHPAVEAAGAAGAAGAVEDVQDRRGEVARVIGAVLGLDAVDLSRSFVQLGGDSLSHVQASVRLEGILGALPRGWHHQPLAELATRGDRGSRPDRPVGHARRMWWGRMASRSLRWRSVESSVLLRAFAVVVICGSHADLFDVMGGAHILLAVAGFNTARFVFSDPSRSGRWRATARMMVGVAVPTVAVATFGMVTSGRYGWSNILLSHWLIGDTTKGSTKNELWFIDALVAGVLVLAVLLSIHALSRAWRRDPWRVALAATGVALVPRFVILAVSDDSMAESIMPTTLWLITVGAAAAHAWTGRRQVVTAAVAVLGAATFFPDQPARSAVLVVGLLVLTLVSGVRLPAPVIPAVRVLAAASLYIYLVQFMVLSSFEDDVVETVAALTVGCLVWRVADRPVRRLQSLIPLSTASTAAAVLPTR